MTLGQFFHKYFFKIGTSKVSFRSNIWNSNTQTLVIRSWWCGNRFPTPSMTRKRFDLILVTSLRRVVADSVGSLTTTPKQTICHSPMFEWYTIGRLLQSKNPLHSICLLRNWELRNWADIKKLISFQILCSDYFPSYWILHQKLHLMVLCLKISLNLLKNPKIAFSQVLNFSISTKNFEIFMERSSK